MIPAPNAIGLLFPWPTQIDRRPVAFTLRGRTYRLGAPGCLTHSEGRSRIPVFNEAGKVTAVTVKETDTVAVTYR